VTLAAAKRNTGGGGGGGSSSSNGNKLLHSATSSRDVSNERHRSIVRCSCSSRHCWLSDVIAAAAALLLASLCAASVDNAFSTRENLTREPRQCVSNAAEKLTHARNCVCMHWTLSRARTMLDWKF